MARIDHLPLNTSAGINLLNGGLSSLTEKAPAAKKRIAKARIVDV